MRYSLKTQFLIFAKIVLLINVVFSVYFFLKSYNREKEEISKNLYKESLKVESLLTTKFDFAAFQLEYINNQILAKNIATHNKKEWLEVVHEVISSIKNLNNLNDTISLSLFSWSNEHHQIEVSNAGGILPSKISLHERDYIKLCEKTPWKMFLGEPVVGKKGKKKIIPIGMGASDVQGTYKGTITSGFLIGNLTAYLNKNLFTKGTVIKIVYFDDEHFGTAPEYMEYIEQHADTLRANVKSGKFYTVLSKPKFLFDTNFSVFYKLQKYPIGILISLDPHIAFADFVDNFIPRLFELMIVIAIILIGLYYLLSRVIGPIIQLSEVAENLAENKPVTIPNGSYKELDVLSKQLERVKNFQYILQKEIINKTIYLEKALDAKNDFLNNISHEVRTPLQGILGISEQLAGHWEEFSEKQRYKYCKLIANSGDRLMDLMQNILDLSKYDNGKMLFEFLYHDIKKLISNVLKEQKPSLLEKKLKVKFNCNIENKIVCDHNRIAQVVRNLLSNSIKYSPMNGTITVYTEQNQDNSVQISIADQGAGIPQEELIHIFMPFIQGSKNNKSGTGLGLSIAKEIVSAHNGKIWAENLPESGAKFIFIIPNNEFLLNKKDQEKLQHSQIEHTIQTKTKKPRIVLVDDEEVCLLSSSMIINRMGYEVISHKNALDALNYVYHYHNKIDIIIIDFMMNEMNGIDFIKMVKQNPECQHLPFIIQTGVADMDLLSEATTMGDNIQILRKPFSQDSMKDTISRALKKYNVIT